MAATLLHSLALSARQEEQQESAVSDFQYYDYVPSMAAAIIFVILFGASTGWHIWQMIKTKTWFLVPFLIGGFLETIGYIGRAVSHTEAPDYTLGPYIIQSIFLLVAPALFAASIYMMLGRIVVMLDAQRALFIRVSWLTKIFVCGDVLSFLMQAAGGGLLSSGDVDTINTGESVVVGGLFVQIVFFGLFVISASIFHVRISRMPTQRCYELPFWKPQMYALYAVSIAIFVRSIVRVVEFLQGYSGFIITHEAFLYVFDAVVMWGAMATMNWIHPGQVAEELRVQRSRRSVNTREEADKEGVRMDYVPV
ncbi:RTA1-domain-containing protein [Hortaea werneckii]|nr:RTA1-domain-containing protein [Hortaea werneckii]